MQVTAALHALIPKDLFSEIGYKAMALVHRPQVPGPNNKRCLAPTGRVSMATVGGQPLCIQSLPTIDHRQVSAL